MNDAELDQLIATAATVSDAEVMAWDLAAPEAHLREEIMSTTDSPASGIPGSPEPVAAAVSDAPTADPAPFPTPTPTPAATDEAGPVVIDLARTSARSRAPRRRRAVALAVAAAVATVAAVGVVTLAGDGTSPDDGAGFQSDQGTGAPAVPPETGVAPQPRPGLTAEDLAVLEALPTIASRLDRWAIVYVDAPTPTEGDMTIADLDGPGTAGSVPAGTTGRLSIRWAPAEHYEEWVADNEQNLGPGIATTVAGQPALTYATELAAPSAPGGGGPVDPPDAGAGEDAGTVVGTSYETVWRVGDHAVIAEGTFASSADHEALLGWLVVDVPEVWASSLPPDAILPSLRAATVDGMLADVPVPPGFDAGPLRDAPGAVRDRYQVGAEVTGAVACGWIDSWVAARGTGDTAAAQAAVDAMASSHDWDVLVEMTSDGGWSDSVWQYADALPTDAPIMGGRPLTIAESYDEALGC